MLSNKFIGKCNLLNSTIFQALFNMGIIWKFQMIHCIIKYVYANNLFKIGIIYHYFICYASFLGAWRHCVYFFPNILYHTGWKPVLSDADADAVVGAMQDGVSSLVNKLGPPSPTGKCKRRGQGRGGRTPTPPQMWTGTVVAPTAGRWQTTKKDHFGIGGWEFDSTTSPTGWQGRAVTNQ